MEHPFLRQFPPDMRPRVEELFRSVARENPDATPEQLLALVERAILQLLGEGNTD